MIVHRPAERRDWRHSTLCSPRDARSRTGRRHVDHFKLFGPPDSFGFGVPLHPSCMRTVATACSAMIAGAAAEVAVGDPATSNRSLARWSDADRAKLRLEEHPRHAARIRRSSCRPRTRGRSLCPLRTIVSLRQGRGADEGGFRADPPCRSLGPPTASRTYRLDRAPVYGPDVWCPHPASEGEPEPSLARLRSGNVLRSKPQQRSARQSLLASFRRHGLSGTGPNAGGPNYPAACFAHVQVVLARYELPPG